MRGAVGCHSAGDGLATGVSGTWAGLESEEERNIGISDVVGCSISQDGRSPRWLTGVLRTGEGVIFAAAGSGKSSGAGFSLEVSLPG